ncbi:hypothetical protein BGX21_009219 [Mortierella sp. AD011]|nr:hypothetical protein BGX21_009219 [Mortierella sp. AD011]
MASGQPSKGTDLRKGNPTSLSVNTTNVRGVKTSIPDLISEEENQVEDDEVDVIRLAQHRPYLQQHLRQPILENKWRRNSGNTDPASTNTGANIASIRSESAPAASAGPTKRRRLLVAVLIPPVKRRINEKPGSSPALGYEESQQPTGSTAAHAQWPSTKKASRLHNQRQKTKPEREREIVTWDRNHRRKARISDDTSSTSSTPSASPAVSPAPSEGSIDSSDRPLSASVKMATGPDFLGPDLLSHKVIPSDGIPSSKGKKDTAENVAEPEDNTRSTRESTPGEGDLGSSSVRYRRYVISRAQKHPQKSSASTSVASRASDNMALPELLRRITPLLRGGSISSASSIDSLVELMSNVDEAGGRKIILNALLSTQSSVILGRFIRSEGLGILRQWIGDARNNPDSPQQQEILQAIIRVLKALPFDVKTLKGNLKGAIALIAGDGDRNHAISKSASDLLQKWSDLSEHTGRSPSRSPHRDKSSSARKKSGFGGSQHSLETRQSTAAQKISQLPRFKLRSPTTSNQSQLPSPVLASTQKDHPVKEEDTQIRHDLSSAPPNRAAASPSRPPTTINFDPLSSQHNKAMEALRKQQKKPKRVQFKDDAELVSIRYFEKYLGGDESANADENEHTKESFDNDDSYSHPEQDSMVSIDHQSVTRQFIIPDNEAKRLIDGVAWTPPQLLYIVFEPDPDGRIQEIAHGEQSTEKYWQAERESQVQSVTYRNIVDIPASPEEPDPETEKVLPTDLASQTQIPLFSRDADHVSVLLQTLTGVYQLITRSSGHL